MKRKILSIALVLGMMLSMLSITPVGASDTTVADSLPYFFNDFEDEIALATGDDVTIVDGGVGGSGKCLKITDENAWVSGVGGYKDRPISDKSGAKLVGDVAGGSTVVISFYIKIPQALTKGDVLFWVDTDDGNVYPIASFDKTNTTGWQKVTVSEVLKDTVTKIEELKFRFGSHGDSTDLVAGDTTKALPRDFYIDDFEITVYKKGLIKADKVDNLSGYYMGFETGKGSISVMDGGYWNVSTTQRTVGTKTLQIVDSPTDDGKALKITMGDTDGWDLALRVSNKTSTGQYDGMYPPASVIPAGATATLSFKYYWAQEMSSSTNPGFCIATTDGSFVMSGTTFATTANQWNTATLTYTNNTGASVDVSTKGFWLRFYHYNQNSTVWKKATLAAGETTNGARTIYLDDFSGKIVAAGATDTSGAVAPVTSGLSITGDFATGNEVSFTQSFMSGDGVATDASVVKLISTVDGKSASLACAAMGGNMTIPEIPAGATLSFEVVPVDSEGNVGQPVSYTYAEVVGFLASLELSDFAADGSVTAKVDMENQKHNQESVNAVLVVLMYDAQGALVKYETKGIVCPYNTVISGDTTEGTLVVSSDTTDPALSKVASAEAYLWDCGTSALPTFKNTTMKELAADVTAVK